MVISDLKDKIYFRKELIEFFSPKDNNIWVKLCKALENSVIAMYLKGDGKSNFICFSTLSLLPTSMCTKV